MPVVQLLMTSHVELITELHKSIRLKAAQYMAFLTTSSSKNVGNEVASAFEGREWKDEENCVCATNMSPQTVPRKFNVVVASYPPSPLRYSGKQMAVFSPRQLRNFA